jgi:hypothetical protein
MPTIDDLYAAFDLLERNAPTELDALPAGMTPPVALTPVAGGSDRRPTSRPRSPRLAWAIVGAAVAASVAIVMVATTGGSKANGPAATASAPTSATSGPTAASSAPSIPASSSAAPSSAPSGRVRTNTAAGSTNIDVGQYASVRIPAKFSYIPAGLKLDSVVTGASKQDHRADLVMLDFGPVVIETVPGLAMKQYLAVYEPTGPKTRQVTINGFTGGYDPDFKMTVLANGSMTVLIDNTDDHVIGGVGPSVPLAEITKILDGMRVVAAPYDESTWFTLRDALP